MDHQPDNSNPFAQRLTRRSLRTAAAVVLATGAGSVGGCMGNHAAPKSPTLTETPTALPDAAVRPLTPEQLTALRIQNYTANINAALDNADAEKFRKPIPDAATAPTTQPAAPKLAATPTTQPTLAEKSPTTQPAIAQATTPTTPTTQPAPIAQATTQPAPLAQATTRPAPLPTPKPIIVRVDPTYPEAMAIVRKRIAAHPTLNTTLALALLDSAEGKAPNPALANALTPSDQKLLTDLLAALQGMSPISPNASLPDRAAPLVDAAKHWQGSTDLTLPKIALASRVDSFGVYTPLTAKFPQGAARTVILYCEVANFATQKTTDGTYETKLTQQESLITADGLLVYRPNPENVDDISFNQRHDFYLVKKITLPDTLPVGKYTLRMDVTDRLANKIAIVKMDLEITPSDNATAFFSK